MKTSVAIGASLREKPWLSNDLKADTPLVYVSVPRCGCVLIYREDFGRLVGLLNDGLTQPGGITTDSAGTLYVSNNNLNGYFNVLEYPAHSFVPSNGLTDTEEPSDVAVASNGTVYVSNRGPVPAIFVYANGSTIPTSELFDANAVGGFGIAIDQKNNVFSE